MLPLYKSPFRPHLEYAVQFTPSTKSTNNGSRTWNSLASSKTIRQLIEVFKYLNRFNNVSPSGLFDYDFHGWTRNNEKNLIVKQFNTSVAQHFFPINITTPWNALPYDVVNSMTVNTFKNRRDANWEDNPPDVQVNW